MSKKSQTRTSKELANSAPTADSKKQSRAGERPLGLCRHCKQLPTCTIEQQEGGVWRCPDFIPQEGD